MHDLVADGNSVILVDHDTQILSESDWIIELGPESGANGGQVISEGTISETISNPNSKIGPFLSDKTNLPKIISFMMRISPFRASVSIISNAMFNFVAERYVFDLFVLFGSFVIFSVAGFLIYRKRSAV